MEKITQALQKDYFAKPHSIWFPDFEEAAFNRERAYCKYPVPFLNGVALLRYFRREITREQFLSQFMELEAPQKMLARDRKLYQCVRELCIAYHQQKICDTDFDEQLLLCFRDRPAEDVFAPAYARWDEIITLMSQLEQKARNLPVHFDGIAWNAYLSGRMTRKEYAEFHLAWGTGDHLAQILAYGVGKEGFAGNYACEISACMGLRRLCIDHKAEPLSPDRFDAEFLKLAKEFCGNAAE